MSFPVVERIWGLGKGAGGGMHGPNFLGKVLVFGCDTEITHSLNLGPKGTCLADIRSHKKLPLQKLVVKPQMRKTIPNTYI